MNNDFEGKVLEYLAHLTQNMTEMRQDINGVQQDINGMRQDINSLQHGMSSLTDRVTNIEVQLENNVSPKISALFDGWQQHTDQLNRIEEKVSTHEEFIIKRIK